MICCPAPGRPESAGLGWRVHHLMIWGTCCLQVVPNCRPLSVRNKTDVFIPGYCLTETGPSPSSEVLIAFRWSYSIISILQYIIPFDNWYLQGHTSFMLGLLGSYSCRYDDLYSTKCITNMSAKWWPFCTDLIVLTLKHWKMHGCIVSTVASDALVLKHQAIRILSTD